MGNQTYEFVLSIVWINGYPAYFSRSLSPPLCLFMYMDVILILQMVWIVDADLNTQSFKDKGAFYAFPKNSKGQTVYCNVEGINFVGRDTIVVVSDKMKGGDRQPAECGGKDQSIHLFTIPDA